MTYSGRERVPSLARLDPGKEQQRSLGIQAGPPGLEAKVKPLARDAEEVRKEVLAAAPAQVRTDLPDQFVPQGSVGPGQEGAAHFGATAREARGCRPTGRLQGKSVEAFDDFVRKRRRQRRPGQEAH
jgi:hypothetical protein